VLRAKAFWITGVEQQADLEDVLQGLVKAVEAGTPLSVFREEFGQGLADQGLNSGQVQAQFRTHTHAAYQQSQNASYQVNPLVENLTYVTAGDDAVRPEHQEWEGITLPKDHEFWDDHTPPCGWNCRCVVRVTSESDTPTALDDERLSLPPDKGFGGSGGDVAGQQIAAQAMAVPVLTPADTAPAKLAAGDDPFAWLKETVPMGNLPRGNGRQSKPAPGFVEMPDGRAVGLSQAAIDAAPTDAREWIRGALQGPSEVWAAPYRDPKGHIALVINALLGVGDRVLCVPVVAGCVPATGLPVRYLTDPREVRCGGRIS
jgi:SPP1 gp7 family putative phage head morphogenesis protein